VYKWLINGSSGASDIGGFLYLDIVDGRNAAGDGKYWRG
jgi:hypothetical protein